MRILYQGHAFDLGHIEVEVQVRYPGRAILPATGLHAYGGWERNLGYEYRFENHQHINGK